MEELLIPYIRVGTTYYKIIERPQISGDKITSLVKWSRETIIQDHGKKYVYDIPKYDGFCCIPNHLKYQKTIRNFYNIYNEIPYQPSVSEVSINDIPFSISFMQHIFGNQVDLGLDYLKILLENPTQILPVLCLVSKERATGKTTFLKWMKEIFGRNMTYIKGDSFNSQFNSDWASMLIIALDEVFFDRKEITERLKYLSTTNKDKLENKGKDREEIDFFGKFILCSNNEENFIQIDENEIRFWVLKINPIRLENTEFLQNLITEIQKLILKNSNKLECKMMELLYEFFESNEETEIEVVPQDILNMLNRMFRQLHYSRNDVRNVLKEKWNLEPQKNGLTYTRYDIDYSGNFYQNNSVGRYFKISKNFILEKYVDLLN